MNGHPLCTPQVHSQGGQMDAQPDDSTQGDERHTHIQSYVERRSYTVTYARPAHTGGRCQFSPGPLSTRMVVINTQESGKASKRELVW